MSSTLSASAPGAQVSTLSIEVPPLSSTNHVLQILPPTPLSASSLPRNAPNPSATPPDILQVHEQSQNNISNINPPLQHQRQVEDSRPSSSYATPGYQNSHHLIYTDLAKPMTPDATPPSLAALKSPTREAESNEEGEMPVAKKRRIADQDSMDIDDNEECDDDVEIGPDGLRLEEDCVAALIDDDDENESVQTCKLCM